MDNQRLLVWATFGILLWFTYQTWMQDYGPTPVPATPQAGTEQLPPEPAEDQLTLPELGEVRPRTLEPRDGLGHRPSIPFGNRVPERLDALEACAHPRRARSTSRTSAAAFGTGVPGPKIPAAPASRRNS